MNIKNVLVVSLFTLLAPLSTTATADTVYIRDTLYVPLRAGESSTHKILHQGLKSGTALKRVNKNKTTGYTEVTTQGGTRGYIQSQYLVESPIAKDQLDNIQSKLDKLSEAHQIALATIATQQAEIDAASAAMGDLQLDVESGQSDLAAVRGLSSNVLAINERNKDLVAERTALDDEIERLQSINSTLGGESKKEWFIIGAATIFLGLLFGFIVSRKIYLNRGGSWS